MFSCSTNRDMAPSSPMRMLAFPLRPVTLAGSPALDSVGSQEPHKTKTADFIDPHKEAAMACHAGADFGVLFAFLVENFSVLGGVWPAAELPIAARCVGVARWPVGVARCGCSIYTTS